MMINTRSIPYFNYPSVFLSHQEEMLSIFQDVGRRGAFIQQKDLAQFEQNLAQYTGAKYALGVANGTDALIMSLLAAGIGRGDEVIFCSHTFVATAAAIHHVGATPVPVECGSDHTIDTEAVRAALTAKTRAILPTQLNGRICDMDSLQTIAAQHDLIIIEDAAQGLGALYNGRAAGMFGLAGTISFYPAKTLGCLGDGGAILTNDGRLYEQLLRLRDHGRRDDGEVVCWGFNSRLDNLQAAILDFGLRRHPQEVARRRELAALYQAGLGHLEELVLPPAPNSDPEHFDAYQNYEIEAEQRDELRAYLKTHGIGTLLPWGGKAVHQFKALGFELSLPYTEKMFTRCLMLPMNTSLNNDDVEYICDMVRHFYSNG
jgi:dTDP-4-amino-4,6-dideoxygalactose transaminase